MKKLPIYGLLIAGYVVILIGVNKLYHGLTIIEVINVPATQETKLNIIPAIIIGVFLLIIALSVGIYLITELWKFFWKHKTLLPIPFLLIALGFLNLAIAIMNGVIVMIETNTQTFIENLTKYIDAFSTLGTYTIVGVLLIGASAVYSVLLDKGLIFN